MAPDYTKTAEKQAEASRQATLDQTWANRPTQNTPWGSTSWEANAVNDPATGKATNRWTETETLNPELQKALSDQLSIQSGRSDIAGGMMDRVRSAYENEFDYSGLPQVPGTAEAAQEASYKRMGELQAPERAASAQNLELELSNRGFTPGSEGWGREMRRASDANSRQDLQNLLASGAEGRAQGQYQQGTRSASIAEQMQKRGMTLNELNALLTGNQVQQPNMPGFTAAGKSETPDLLGAASGQYGANMDAYNAKAGQSGQTASTIGSIAGIAAIAL
jgi:hypothetical protein